MSSIEPENIEVLAFKIEPKGGASASFRSETDVLSITGAEAPSPEIVSLVRSLKGPLCEIIDVPKTWSEDMTVHGISVDAKKEHAGITASKKVDGMNPVLPVNLSNIPLTPSDNSTMSRDAIGEINKTIDALFPLAARYVAGKERSQGQLFPEDAPKPPAKKKRGRPKKNPEA